MREASLRTQIALGWITILLVLCWIFAILICQSAMDDNDFRALLRDPGIQGLPSVIYIGAFYALMPLYVNLVKDFRIRVLRWIAVAAAGLGLVFWILHHLSHALKGERTTFTSNVLDLTLHALGLWVLLNTIKWAKLPFSASDTNEDSIPEKAALQRS